MMKHTGSLALGLGLFLGLPAFTFGGGLPDSIGDALDDTLEALEVLGKLKDDIEQGQPTSPGTVEALTEAPSGTSQVRDERLGQLRDEVSDLQSQLDTQRLRSGARPVTPLGGTDEGVTTGLPQTFVRAMGQGDVAGQGEQPQAGQPQDAATTDGSAGDPADVGSGEASQPETITPEPPVSPEGKGYSAHPLRQAKACFRAGRYQLGLDVLEAVTPFTEGDYWRAKCLDRLGRTDEALLLFAAVEVAEDAGPLADAAKRDAEFAVWRRELEKKAGLREESE